MRHTGRLLIRAPEPVHSFELLAVVSSGRASAPLSAMCLTLQHLSGLDRNNPRPNSGGCHLEICAGKESVSAYSNKPPPIFEPI